MVLDPGGGDDGWIAVRNGLSCKLSSRTRTLRSAAPPFLPTSMFGGDVVLRLSFHLLPALAWSRRVHLSIMNTR